MTDITGWQLDRSAPAAYEQYLVPPLFEPWADRLLDTVGIRDGDRVLDVACGTGIVARRAAERLPGGAVVGLDVNEGMLEVAATAAGDAPIEWRQGDAMALPFDDGRFDVCVCQQALQFVDDPGEAIEEMRRVLTDGGRLGTSVWRSIDDHPTYRVLAEALATHAGDSAGALLRSPFPDWDGEYLEELAETANLRDVTVTVETGSFRYPSPAAFVKREAASSPLAAELAATPDAVRAELVSEVSTRLEEYTDDDGVVIPMESFVLTARR